jgi:lipid II:glycine glycyltransferase (peptidoglycan interpeptide bridge formation enzyme)
MAEPRSLNVERIDRAGWPAIAASFSDHNYEQTDDYALAMAQKSGSTAHFYVVKDGESTIGAASVRLKTFPLVGRGVAYISGGPLVQRPGTAVGIERYRLVLGAFKRELVDKERHFLFVRLPVAPPPASSLESVLMGLGFRATKRTRSYRTVVVKIASNAQAQRASLAGKWRTDLKFAEKSNLSIEQGCDSTLFTRFMTLFGSMHEAKNFDVHVDPQFFFCLPSESTGLVVIIATKDGQDAAGHVLSMLGETAVYLFGATNDLGRSNKAGYLLNWQSLMLAMEQGLSWYDLGGIDPDANPGVYRFKKRMGGEEFSALGPYEAYPDDFLGAATDRLLTLRDLLKSR